MGRVDDVLNVAGHRLGTAEIESASSPARAWPKPRWWVRRTSSKGRASRAFVTLKAGVAATPEIKKQISDRVVREIGALARPDEIRFTDALPKTRSGKIMRRLLKEVATSGVARGDTTTLEDVTVLTRLAATREEDE